MKGQDNRVSMKMIFATGNEGKMREIRQILGDMDVEILSMKEAGIGTDIVEDGSTFEENAIIKAKAVAAQTDAVVLADDSGLEIDYLNKEPGIYSARYLGEDTPYSVKNQKILDRLAGVPDEKRTARFVCAIAAVLPDGEVLTSHGVVEGRIMREVRGKNGFGYDPIFYSNDLGCGMAEVPEEEKNKISHRGRALEAMRRQLERKRGLRENTDSE
jgi:XTP/dITP diphosphohydrolase